LGPNCWGLWGGGKWKRREKLSAKTREKAYLLINRSKIWWGGEPGRLVKSISGFNDLGRILVGGQRVVFFLRERNN